jgi:hypothetical protein
MSQEQPPFDLYPDEQVLRRHRAVHLRSTPARIGFNPLNGDFWLTDRRILFKPDRDGGLTGNPVAYPTGRVTATSIVAVRVDLASYRPVRLDFDDGGSEYFEFKGSPDAPEEWRQAIDAARAGAPVVPYETATTQQASVEGAGGRTWRFVGLLVGGIILAVVVVCLLLALAGSLMGSRPSGGASAPAIGAIGAPASTLIVTAT